MSAPAFSGALRGLLFGIAFSTILILAFPKDVVPTIVASMAFTLGLSATLSYVFAWMDEMSRK